MSNAIDILLVGGPRNGTMVCMSRERLTTYVEIPFVADDTDGAHLLYTRIQWANIENGKAYHIAVYDSNVTNGQILETVNAKNFQPAWDLNR